jgi:putative DNA primase/helicase
MANITGILGDKWNKAPENIDPPEMQLADAMRQAGIEPPIKISLDGQLHRFGTKGRKKDDSGWYVAFDDGIPAGRFGCWRDGIEQSWKADVGRELTASEQMAISRRTAEARATRDAERQKKNEIAASTVDTIWEKATGAEPDHPYLHRKGISTHGARVTGDGRLIVPMRHADGALSSLQYISVDGDKKYHPGGAVKGCFWILGTEEQTIFIAEGFATAATIQEVTGQSVAIAYSAGNIPAVAMQMRDRYGPTQNIVIVADNDESGVGKNYADQAAAKMGARIVIPPEHGDANDYRASGGDLNELLYPPTTEWVVDGDVFSDQPAPISWLVKHWLQSKALVMVHGPSGGGKTFVVLDWMLHMAAGIPEWMGHKVKQSSILYLAGEGHHGLKGRIAAWKQHHGISSLNQSFHITMTGCDLNTPEGYQKVREAILAMPKIPDVLGIDTLNRNFYGDENSAQDTKGMLDYIALLQNEFGITIVLVHHTGVSDEAQHRARGSSAWKGALDVEISIVPSKNDGPIGIIQRKSKDAEEAEDMWVDLQSVPIKGWFDEDEEQVTSAVVVSADAPIKASKDTKLSSAMKIFNRAWHKAKWDIEEGMPYVTKSAMRELLDADGMAERTIQNHMSLSACYNDLTIGQLISSESIVPHRDGWIVNDRVWGNALRIQKGKKPSP